MKITTALAALLIVSTAAFATGGDSNDDKKAKKSKVAVINNSQSKYKVVYMDEAKGKVTLKLKNERGETVDTRVVRNDGGFAQPYDLESLPAGKYTFEVTTSKGTETQTVEHTKAIAEKAKKTKSSLKANILDISGNQKYRLVALSEEANPISVKIYGDDDKLLHSEMIRNTDAFRKVFDLESIEDDNIRFEISNGSDSVYMTAK